MKRLTCEMCGSTDLIKQNGVFVCQVCGCKYSVEEARKMIIEGTVDVSGSTVKIDRTEEINEQIAIWEKMAGDAFDNKNFSEAYTYYCKILEKRVTYWFATYRKGMCIGWQGDLKNMHTNEVLGGVTDAIKLLVDDETQSDSSKANGLLLMAQEVHDWVGAINSLAVGHGNKFANELVSEAKEFYQREQVVATLAEFNYNMLNEFIYKNCDNKEDVEELINSMYSTGQSVVINLKATFRVKTGSKWSTFWEMYQDVYENVTPDYMTTHACEKLSSAMEELKNRLQTWKKNHERELADERRAKFWEEHSEEKNQYESRIGAIDSELKILEETSSQYDERIVNIKKDWYKKLPEEKQLDGMKQQQGDLMCQKSLLGLFDVKQKKQLQTQINALQRDIDSMQTSINNQKRAMRDDVESRAAAAEKERQPFKDRIKELEQEKRKINEELTKDR